MTKPRSQLIQISDTPFYHLTSRCVRRQFLCGYDTKTNKNYEHRKDFIEQRLRLLSSIFAIDLCAYAVMSNHYHVVVQVNLEESDNWSETDVLERWTSIFKGPPIVQKFMNNQPLVEFEQLALKSYIADFRKRLTSISWFMKCLNEPIARMANKEDKVTGHFWESRFKSQALLTEEALLSCMTYVDLNPVRAKMAPTPESSDFTSIKERIQPCFDPIKAIKHQLKSGLIQKFDLPIKPLAKFEGSISLESGNGIQFSLEDYLTLVDWTGRVIREDKRGSIDSRFPSILNRIDMSTKSFLDCSSQFEQLYNSRFRRRQTEIAA